MKQTAHLRSGWMLVVPLLSFIAVLFVVPIATMLWKGIYDAEVADLLPATTRSLALWSDEGKLPPAASLAALADDLRTLDRSGRVAELSFRMNRKRHGFRDLIERSAIRLRDEGTKLEDIDSRWSDPVSWQVLKQATEVITPDHLLNALDLDRMPDGSINRQDEGRRIYLRLLGRTILVAAIVTCICVVLGYPFAHILAAAKGKRRTVLLFVVLLPFWTSLLVRTTAWIVLLQRQGVINELLVSAGIIADRHRFALIYNFSGTIITMVYVLLPFFVLPLQAVMRGIPGQYVKAAASLGGSPIRVFQRIYLPMTMPGVAAGASLVFILSLGYYVTPALVGGRTGQLISNQIAFHIQSSLNWGLAAALGTILLALVAAMCLLLSRFAGQGRITP
ncbi:ABC transporter permease [Rhizobium rhizosphaerae]|uniref:ABC transporter permease n=1 Tax=Xaviernesmea rhizosphaerae TaxID=1672749 RepID=A0A1Q9AKP3_9HYPH|nr:ABC transporter permease [Xaviernesmea rhizosphaerae]OLP55803.1 ABC transporter permease [Xaviernesmea rhizosphaerae]